MQYLIIIALLGLGAFLFFRKSSDGGNGGNGGNGKDGEIEFPDNPDGNTKQQIQLAYRTACNPLMAWLRNVKNQYNTLVSENVRTCGGHAHNVSYPQLVDRCNQLLAHYDSGRWLAASDLDVIVNTWDVIKNGAWMPHLQGLKSHGRDCDVPTEVHINAVQMQVNKLNGINDILIDFYVRFGDHHPEPIWDSSNPPTYNF